MISNYLVTYLRMITSMWLKTHEDDYAPFVSLVPPGMSATPSSLDCGPGEAPRGCRTPAIAHRGDLGSHSPTPVASHAWRFSLS